jgi:hypothetical protein
MKYQVYLLLIYSNILSICVHGHDLSKSIGESKDIAKSNPGLTQSLYKELLAWHEATDAPRPTQFNPNYDPKAQPIRGRENRGKGGGGGNEGGNRGNGGDRGDRQNQNNRQNQNR